MELFKTGAEFLGVHTPKFSSPQKNLKMACILYVNAITDFMSNFSEKKTNIVSLNLVCETT